MKRHMKAAWVGGCLVLAGLKASGQAEAPLPERWSENVAGPATEWSSPAAFALLPVEWTVRMHASTGTALSLQVLAAPDAQPLLNVQFRMLSANRASVSAAASGERMQTDLRSARTWSRLDEPSGSVAYGWRFPTVRNLWEERDRREIGSAYAKVIPFQEKSFVFRLVLANGLRQVWLDDRLVAESALPNPPAAGLKIRFQDAVVESTVIRPVPADGYFLPLPLTAYSHTLAHPPSDDPGERIEVAVPGGPAVPLWLPPAGTVDVDLGESLYRYRLTDGSGPDASYVNATHAWPGAFTIDPAMLTFRVPHRPWQTAWLLVWTDADPVSVPAGVFRFFRPQAGYPAATPFEITEEAIRAGRVIRLGKSTAEGRPLYLVRAALDTDGLAGMADMAGQFMEFELAKPLSLFRDYPDPIYYGYHPAGPPSSIHVVGITLEEAPFDYEVRPDRLGHVFVRPEKAGYAVAVTNRTDRPMVAAITLETTSFGGLEMNRATGTVSLAAREEKAARLVLNPARQGWHELRVRVEAGGAVRTNTLSLVMLPPDTRTYGYADTETRFGIWTLWGHYLPMVAGAYERNAEWLAVMRKLGLRRAGGHDAFIKTAALTNMAFLTKAPHTFVSVFHRLNQNDPEAMRDMVSNELAQVAADYDFFPKSTYFYGGEWHLGREIQYAPWPRYTGDGDRPLTPEEQARADRHIKIFTAIGKAMRAKFPKTKLVLQWGAPLGTVAYMKSGFPKELADAYGMDAPMFELLPENPIGVGSIQHLWGLRQEADRLGWPQLPIAWCEGPFFPTSPGALTEEQQAQYQIRYWLAGLAYGVEDFEAGVVDFDGGNYYGAEHYGAGIFHRRPLAHPKPAVAVVATATAMLCGAEPKGFVDLGVPTTCCMPFKHPKEGMRYALWRVAGRATVKLNVIGAKPMLTDSMGNTTPLRIANGEIEVPVDESPVWLTGVEKISAGRVEAPVYREAPAPWTRPLADFTDKLWKFDPVPDKSVTNRHFAVRRIPEPGMKVEFKADEDGHPGALAVTLQTGLEEKPLAQRVAMLRAKRPIPIPGVPAALGVWVKGNGSWGRIVYRIRDAKGEEWSSTGTKDDWNCDDPYGWSYVNFEGWRYVRFPLPGNAAWDGARSADSVWWGSLGGGNGIPEPPFTLTALALEARNEVPVAGVMVPVKDRTYKLSGLVAEYDAHDDALPGALRSRTLAMPLPDWKGPTDNPMARLAESAAGEAPAIDRFDEPHHFNDGRRMLIKFEAKPGFTYNLYLSRYESGTGAELLKAGVTDGLLVTGLKPETSLYLFLTAVGADKKESKPSKPFRLVTRDNFAEK